MWLIKGLGPGGAERLLVGAARRHDRDRFRLSVAYLLPWKDHLRAELEREAVTATCLEARGIGDPRWPMRLRALLRADPPDIVHIHSPAVAPIARLALHTLPAARRPRSVSTEHNSWRSHRWATRTLNTLTTPLDSASLVVSAEARASVPPRIRGRFETVTHGIVLDDAALARAQRAAYRAELGFTDDDLVVITVANHRRHKCWPDVLAAARIVADGDRRVQFLGVGQGPDTDEITARHAELGLAGRYRLLGHRTDVLPLLAASDVFLLASAHEGLPVAVMEAMAMGLPVVATAVGDVPTIVADGVTGRLVPTGRPDLLAAAVLDLARDPELRATMAASTLQRAEDLDIGRAVRRIEDVYELVAS